MMYSAPNCLTCKYFKGRPTKPGENAKCSVRPNGAPKSIYFEGKSCPKYSAKSKR